MEPVTVTEADRDRHLESELEGAPQEIQARVRRSIAALPLPEFFPPYRTMVVDSELNVWLKEYPTSSHAPNDWAIFDASGMWLGTLTLPEGLSVYEIGDDYVLGKTEDDLGVERVVVYGLMKGMGIAVSQGS